MHQNESLPPLTAYKLCFAHFCCRGGTKLSPPPPLKTAPLCRGPKLGMGRTVEHLFRIVKRGISHTSVAGPRLRGVRALFCLLHNQGKFPEARVGPHLGNGMPERERECDAIPAFDGGQPLAALRGLSKVALPG